MLQRVFIYFCLILLFAFTQIGLATHEISHLTGDNHPHQQDKNSHESQCEQCLVLSHAAHAPLAHSFVFFSTPIKQIYLAKFQSSPLSCSASPYSARAPPPASQA